MRTREKDPRGGPPVTHTPPSIYPKPPIPTRDDRYPEDELDILSIIPSIHVWVEGRVTIWNWDEDSRLLLDKARPLLEEIGLSVCIQEVAAGGVEVRKYARRAARNVTAVELLAVLKAYPGRRADFYAEAVYKTTPWGDAAKAVALDRFKHAVYRLKHRCSRHYDPEGHFIYGPAGWRPTPASFPSSE